jgi:hypothetical protein
MRPFLPIIAVTCCEKSIIPIQPQCPDMPRSGIPSKLTGMTLTFATDYGSLFDLKPPFYIFNSITYE